MSTLDPLSHIDELDAAIAESRERPVLLFKHSRSCGVSCEALDELHFRITKRRLDDAFESLITNHSS
jgi:bacillithiol system protein YtxJ